MTPILDDAFMCDSVPAEIMDELWAGGWRHFGRYFFRYSSQPGEHGGVQTITPLRITLASFSCSKSQRRVLNKNADLRHEVVPAVINDEMRAMFQRHKGRFTYNVPDSLETFLGPDPATGPCECRMVRVLDADGRLRAASFFDAGRESASSVYGFFDPDESHRSLGIFTMLLEIQHCQEQGLKWIYPGYATKEPSPYDYKKQFRATQWLEWETGEWRDLE
ncbi:MAG: GNAT family N-acetyltransferase [Prosthecobacter sp.]